MNHKTDMQDDDMAPNQRRALSKGLAALETMADLWAVEVRLAEMSQRIAAVEDQAERAKRIEALIHLGFVEGAYRHFLDHKDALAAPAPVSEPQAICQTCNGNGVIGGPSYYAPDEGGEPCPDCCDTPSLCSSVRRCTAKDAEQPSEFVAWEYSFIHSSATGCGDSKVGPCLTYDREIAYGVGCIDQREVTVSHSAQQRSERAADMRKALEWAAGTLQTIVSGRWRDVKEGDRVSIGATVKTISDVLDMADEALSTKTTQQDCPHGVDDGACKQCYGEAVSGEQGAAFEYIRDALHETYGFASTSPRGQENINFALGKLDEIEDAMRAYLGPKYCPPSSEPDDSFLSPVSVAAPQPQAAEPKGLTCSLGCATECFAELHGCASECPFPAKRRALLAKGN